MDEKSDPRETGKRKTLVSEMITEKNRSVISSQNRRPGRWAEHFEDQFDWLPATLQLNYIEAHPEWDVYDDPSTLTEVEKAVVDLKQGRAAGPDRLPPNVFKEDGRELLVHLSEVLGNVWRLRTVLPDLSRSLIVPLYKRGKKSSCANHRGISLTNIVSEILGDMTIRRITGSCEQQTLEN